MLTIDTIQLDRIKEAIDDWTTRGVPSLDNILVLSKSLNLLAAIDKIDITREVWEFKRACIVNMLYGTWITLPGAYTKYVTDAWGEQLNSEQVKKCHYQYINFVIAECKKANIAPPTQNKSSLILHWLQLDDGEKDLLEVVKSWYELITWVLRSNDSTSGFYGSTSFNTANSGNNVVVLGRTGQEITQIVYEDN